MNKTPIFKKINEYALLIEFEQAISPEINNRAISLENFIVGEKVEGVLETIPAYASLTIVFNPFLVDHDTLEKRLLGFLKDRGSTAPAEEKRMWNIPVCYDEEFSVDLGTVASANGYTRDECIRFHSQAVYRVYMLGFMPGFVYLGGLDERLNTPRLSTPRTKIAGGSVAIGGNQTGMYSLESPSGWNIIGRSPIRLFKAAKEQICPIKSGDSLKFNPVSMDEFTVLKQRFQDNNFNWEDLL